MNSRISAVEHSQTVRDDVRQRAADKLAKIKRRTLHDFESVVYVADQDGYDFEIRVGICYDATYDPGRLTGPWEDSYPAYGELNITEIVILDDLPASITEAMVKSAAESCERITDEAWEDYHAKTAEGPDA